MRTIFASVLLLLAHPCVGGAQERLPATLPVDCQRLLVLLSATRGSTDREPVARQLVAMNLHSNCLAEAFVADERQKASYAPFLKMLERIRTDKQNGSSVGSQGSTTLVSKGASAKVLSLAAEYGALTESVNKTIITVQGSADGVPAALIRHNVVPYCPSSRTPGCIHSTLIETLQRFSYAISFDASPAAQGVTGTPAGTAQGSAQPVTFTAGGQAVTGVTLRAVVWNARDRVSKTFQSAWITQVTKNAKPLSDAASNLMLATTGLITTTTGDPNYEPWQDETVRQLVAASSRDQETAIWNERLRVLAELLGAAHPDLLEKAKGQLSAMSVYRFEEDAVVAVLQKPIATVQYDFKRPASQPSTSTVRFIFDKGLSDGWSIAVNAAVEIYSQTPSATIAGAGRLRDVQVGIQFQRDLGTLDLLGAVALAGTYYFQHQSSPAILNITPSTPLDGVNLIGLSSTATQVFSTKGNIHVAQLRFVLGPQNSSARFPLSLTYSNRTDLIDKPAWRAQIGVSYDFDSLFGG